jgi:hypothetical protein
LVIARPPNVTTLAPAVAVAAPFVAARVPLINGPAPLVIVLAPHVNVVASSVMAFAPFVVAVASLVDAAAHGLFALPSRVADIPSVVAAFAPVVIGARTFIAALPPLVMGVASVFFAARRLASSHWLRGSVGRVVAIGGVLCALYGLCGRGRPRSQGVGAAISNFPLAFIKSLLHTGCHSNPPRRKCCKRYSAAAAGKPGRRARLKPGLK